LACGESGLAHSGLVIDVRVVPSAMLVAVIPWRPPRVEIDAVTVRRRKTVRLSEYREYMDRRNLDKLATALRELNAPHRLRAQRPRVPL
jgi:hypothetical protein